MLPLLLALALGLSCAGDETAGDGGPQDAFIVDRLRVDAAQVIFQINWELCVSSCQPRDLEVLLLRARETDAGPGHCILRQQRLTNVEAAGQAILEAIDTSGGEPLTLGVRLLCPESDYPLCPACTGHVEIRPLRRAPRPAPDHGLRPARGVHAQGRGGHRRPRALRVAA